MRFGLRGRLVVWKAVFEQQHPADMHGRRVDVELDTGAAGRRDDATPVGIGAVDCRLDQRRVGDRFGNALRIRADQRGCAARRAR